jgi:hypothetical protein
MLLRRDVAFPQMKIVEETGAKFALDEFGRFSESRANLAPLCSQRTSHYPSFIYAAKMIMNLLAPYQI